MKNEPIRGNMYAVRVHFQGRSWWQWYAEVWQGRTLLWSDNCRDPHNLIPDFKATLTAFRRLAEIGQRFESWVTITERAGRHL